MRLLAPPTLVVASLVAVAWLLSPSLGWAEEATGASELPNVVVILIDTVRADHTSLEGYPRDTTPGIAAIAEEGLTFRRHFANAPWTRPSVASILTGLLPPSHGAQWGDHKRPQGQVDLLSDAFATLPELLKPHGYATHAFMNNPTVSQELGFGQGFDQFELTSSNLTDDRRAIESTQRALDRAEGPIFVWCHLMAPHNYRVPGRPEGMPRSSLTPITKDDEFGSIMIERYQMRTREQAVARYDATLTYADGLVAELVEHVRERHPNTLVIITSDHGEEFAEHGGYLHSRTLYNELLRVPLVLWGPGIPAGEEVDRLTSSVDILPTIVRYLGLPPVRTQGRSLLDESPQSDRLVYAEKRNGLDARRAWITSHGKLIETKPPGDPSDKPPMAGAGTFEFFIDPAGRDDASVDPVPEPILTRAQRQLEAVWKASRAIYEETVGEEAARGTLTEEDREKLRALGYVD